VASALDPAVVQYPLGRQAHLRVSIVPEKDARDIDAAAREEHGAGPEGQRGEPALAAGLKGRLLYGQHGWRAICADAGATEVTAPVPAASSDERWKWKVQRICAG
jgi:hypothetical protein